MRAYLQILSTGTADCPPSVILHFDQKRYMINCGEGIQRLCTENKVRLSKLQTLMFTRTHWDCTGGLPGNSFFYPKSEKKPLQEGGGEKCQSNL